MIPLTRRDVLAHQAAVPWPSQHQVEQDLLLCRAIAALFNFCTDMDQLLRVGEVYDPRKAGDYVRANLLSLLPEY